MKVPETYASTTAVLLVAALTPAYVQGQEQITESRLQICAAKSSAIDRLMCYDEVAGQAGINVSGKSAGQNWVEEWSSFWNTLTDSEKAEIRSELLSRQTSEVTYTCAMSAANYSENWVLKSTIVKQIADVHSGPLVAEVHYPDVAEPVVALAMRDGIGWRYEWGETNGKSRYLLRIEGNVGLFYDFSQADESGAAQPRNRLYCGIED